MRSGLDLGLGVLRGVPFAPSALRSALVLWHRGDSYVIAGSGVSQWSDLSGHGNHSVQLTDAIRPTIDAAGISGRSCVRSFGNQYLIGPNLSALTAGHIFAVLRADGDPAGDAGAAGNLWALGTGANSYYPFSDGVIYESAGTSTRKTVGNPTPALTDPHVYEVISTSSEYTVKLDGAQLFTTASNTVAFPASPHLCGSGSWKGRFAEMIICNMKLASFDALRVRQYLGGSYGIIVS